MRQVGREAIGLFIHLYKIHDATRKENGGFLSLICSTRIFRSQLYPVFRCSLTRDLHRRIYQVYFFMIEWKVIFCLAFITPYKDNTITTIVGK